MIRSNVVVTRRAALQLERAALWWRNNRPAAPDAVADDFEDALRLLSLQPELGARSASPRYPDLRRLYLSRIRYHVYYQALQGKVVVLAFWHASRQSPSL
ncbi:MAG: type II toxin-antitoxin system RelE/ParE family toxin [Roseateles sp.]